MTKLKKNDVVEDYGHELLVSAGQYRLHQASFQYVFQCGGDPPFLFFHNLKHTVLLNGGETPPTPPFFFFGTSTAVVTNGTTTTPALHFFGYYFLGNTYVTRVTFRQ